MRLRSITAIVFVAAVALVASACSNDDGGSTASTTSAVEEAGGADTGATSGDDADGPAEAVAPVDPLDDEEFAAAVEGVRSDLTAAGDDPCKLVQSQGVDLVPEPVGPTQSQMTVELFAEMMGSMADALDANGKGESAASLRGAAEQVVAEGQAAGYSEEFMTETPAALADEAVARAQTDFMALVQSCGGADGASG